jgi:predicted DsbA family dithiol-disulfide isomerase
VRRFGAVVEWRPFDLHPEYPPQGIPRTDLLRRYGVEFHDNLERWFEREGLAYNPPPEVVPNSRAALRLTEVARAQGLHEATHDRLMLAYWEQALNIGDPAVLLALATEIGLEEAETAISGDLHGDTGAAATAAAHAIGINAIPAFLIDNRLVVLGAQPDDVFERVFAELESGAEAP